MKINSISNTMSMAVRNSQNSDDSNSLINSVPFTGNMNLVKAKKAGNISKFIKMLPLAVIPLLSMSAVADTVDTNAVDNTNNITKTEQVDVEKEQLKAQIEQMNAKMQQMNAKMSQMNAKMEKMNNEVKEADSKANYRLLHCYSDELAFIAAAVTAGISIAIVGILVVIKKSINFIKNLFS